MKQISITLGQFIPGHSFIHRLDPRTKMFICFLFMLTVLYSKRFDLLIFYLVFSIIAYQIAGINPVLAFYNLKPFLLLFTLTFFIHVFFTDGDILWEFKRIGIAVTRQGFFKGGFYTIRISILVIIAGLLTLTTQPMALTDAIERLLSPFKRFGIPAHEIGMMLSISLRFIPTLLEETERIKRAQLSRGRSIEKNIIGKIKSIIPLIIPLFISTFRRANELAYAMDARCYRGGEGRTNFKILAFNFKDGIALFLVMIITIPVFFLR